MMESYRDLEVFKDAKRLALKVHELSMLLPKHELYEEGSQVRRSSKAIAATIVEGYGRRRYKNDFLKYLVYAHAECDETILHLDFIKQTNKGLETLNIEQLSNEYQVLSKKIFKFTAWVEKSFIPPNSNA